MGSNGSPHAILQEFASQATSFGLNLNGTIDLGQLAFRGGTAAVYQGLFRQSGLRVAVKVGVTSLPDAKTVKLILREAHLWSKLDHENVLPLMGITTDFHITVSLVSKWMAKGNAHSYVQDKAVDPRPLIVDIARGLCYLHNHPKGPIIHGDLKGANVLISEDGRALLADFSYSVMSNSSFKLVSSPKGFTPNWMSPEIANGDCTSSVESDIWAFGMTALELFTREIPFAKFRIEIIAIQIIMNGAPGRPSDASTCSRMTDDWWDICLLCWQRDPSSRPTMSEIVRRIVAIPDPLKTNEPISEDVIIVCVR
ncbi:hypothetical protein ID866_9059 [Astraeus odoratus]|nr:hypothetical protein ID866_9059 [Astraeus odoratus]